MASEYLKRIKLAALTWPLAMEMTDVDLETLLFHPVGGVTHLVEAHPEQGSCSCLGIMRLAQPYGPDALEAACERALTIGAQSYSSVHSIPSDMAFPGAGAPISTTFSAASMNSHRWSCRTRASLTSLAAKPKPERSF
ncbi:hypothetical protein SAMN04488004_107195 [Loktanella salsilacus]|uniref:Uncharacterized protein n=1 Tax=Loktanella salsilacus TaxID=195913 RepID=A0A1I4EUH5_9RHOB|nr:hypothetical protein SAMN04488004_107195 [Loktanella salsilacus]